MKIKKMVCWFNFCDFNLLADIKTAAKKYRKVAHRRATYKGGFATNLPPCQGTILDRIDYNIEQAADRVGNAVVELGRANEYQKKSRTMLCIYLLLLLCGFMVIVLILKKTALGA